MALACSEVWHPAKSVSHTCRLAAKKDSLSHCGGITGMKKRGAESQHGGSTRRVFQACVGKMLVFRFLSHQTRIVLGLRQIGDEADGKYDRDSGTGYVAASDVRPPVPRLGPGTDHAKSESAQNFLRNLPVR